MFGDWEIIVNGKKLEKFTSKKAVKILFYLILFNGSRIPLKDLAQNFWKGLDYDYVRKNLNSQLYYIRKDLGIKEEYLRSEREYVYINKNFFQSDYQDFMSLVNKAHNTKIVEKMIKLYRGELLQWLTEGWVVKHRMIVKNIYI